MLRYLLTILFITASFGGLHSYFSVKLRPSMDIFSDSFGWGANLGFENDLRWISKGLPEGLYWGLNFYTFGSSVTNLNYYSFNGGLSFGYRVTVGKRALLLSTGLTAGGGSIHLQNILTNADTGAFYLYPEISVDIPIGNAFQIGVNAGYRMYFLALYNNLRMVNSLQAGIGFTYAFYSADPALDPKQKINPAKR